MIRFEGHSAKATKFTLAQVLHAKLIFKSLSGTQIAS